MQPCMCANFWKYVLAAQYAEAKALQVFLKERRVIRSSELDMVDRDECARWPAPHQPAQTLLVTRDVQCVC